MRSKLLHIILGVLLSITLCFNLGIRQYIHSFEHHEDTIHTSCGLDHDNNYTDKFIDNLHHHCDYVSDLLPAFINATINFEFVTLSDVRFQEFVTSTYSIHKEDAPHQFLLRGPPSYTFFS